VHGDRVEAHSSSKRPSHAPGDLVVLYASVWQAVYGVAEVTAPAEHDPAKARWAWRFPLRPLAVIDDLDRAIPAEEVGVFPRSLWRHSYIRLSEEQFGRARAAVLGRASVTPVAPTITDPPRARDERATFPAPGGRRRRHVRWQPP
jgi:hypothetical protein